MGFLGKEIRMRRLIPEADGHYFGLTVDHSMARGVLSGLDTIDDTLKRMLAGCPDAITMHKGLAERCFPAYAGKIPLVLKCTTFSPYHFDEDIVVADVEEAVRMGADAVSVGCIVGGDTQRDQLKTLARFSKLASSAGMPLISHIYPRGNNIKEDQYSVKNVLYAARMAAEVGVDLIKTNYTGDTKSFAEVVRAVPCRVAVAGGEKAETAEEFLQMTRDVMDSGAVGVTYGRFIFTYRNPTALVKAVRRVIHENIGVKEATEYLYALENERVD